ncbi:MAG TPA: hypothetical protein VGR41_09890 [Actinomycetota bacterium]|nr:hypothetical protein [Actinomycetota bacterium]
MDWATQLLDAVAPVLDGATPAFITGDFNSPSYRDWTAAVSDAGPDVRFPSRVARVQGDGGCGVRRLLPRGPSGPAASEKLNARAHEHLRGARLFT